MKPISLTPGHSTKEIPGKCIMCLAEQEINNCLLELIKGEGENKELEQRFDALVAFLQSPESKALRDQSEKYLAEGKHVTLRISLESGKPMYEMKVEEISSGGA